MPDRICSFPDCGRKHSCKGLCGTHYAQQRRGRDLTPIPDTTRADELRALIVVETDECVLVPWRPDARQPTVWLDGRDASVGAAALILSGSPRPEGMHCCHDPDICNNGRCCNPRHVRWDTRAENMADKLVSDTHTRGERCSTAVLTEAQVHEIRDLLATTDLFQREIAARYGISRTTVSQIKLGKRWSWLD